MVRIIFKFKLLQTDVLSDFISTITGKKYRGRDCPRQSIAVRHPNVSISYHFSDLSSFIPHFSLFVLLLLRELFTRSRTRDRSISSNFCHIPSIFQYIHFIARGRSLVIRTYLRKLPLVSIATLSR